MLPKKNRVSTREVNKIFKACPPNGREGRFVFSPSLTFKYIKKATSQTCGNSHMSDLWLEPKISVIAPKSVAKLAIIRNLLRRRGYRVLSRYIDQFPIGIIGVFVFKKNQNDIYIIENEIKNILKKIN